MSYIPSIPWRCHARIFVSSIFVSPTTERFITPRQTREPGKRAGITSSPSLYFFSLISSSRASNYTSGDPTVPHGYACRKTGCKQRRDHSPLYVYTIASYIVAHGYLRGHPQQQRAPKYYILPDRVTASTGRSRAHYHVRIAERSRYPRETRKEV